MIRCRVLGPIEVTLHGAPAPAELLWKKNLALLLYLARSPARRCSRDHAVGLLWADKSEAAARQSLREAIRVLRRHAGDDAFETTADQIQLRDGAVELDCDDFDRLMASGDGAAAARLVAGEFAEGFLVPDASGFETWLAAERLHWRIRAGDALLTHAEQRLEAGDLPGSDEPARRALHLDPLSHRAIRVLMRRLALAGDRAGALALHAEFTARAAQDQRVADPETDALAARLRRGREWRLPREAFTPERSAEWRRSPLVGRERELALALDQWRRARSGRPALLVIEAASGGGKTRLAEEIVARVALDGGASVALRAVPADLDHPGSGALNLARGGLLDAVGVAGAQRGALAALARYDTDWADRFPEALKDPSAWDVGPALSEVIRAACAEQPLVLVLDDAQWLDEASLRLVQTLVRDLATAPLLVILAATPEPAPPVLAELRARIGRDVPGAAITLPALETAALRALAHWALPGLAPDQADRLARRVAADSAGLPLLAVEICHAVAVGLDLDATSGAWPRPLRTLDQTLPGDLPDTIVAAIRVGFRRLTRDAQTVLEVAAVLDAPAGAALARVSGLQGDALHAALDELEWRQWLVAGPDGYAFRARIVRDVVARDMVTAGRRQRILEAATTA